MITQPIIDITLVPTYSGKTLGIADISVYPNNFTILNPSIEITAPGLRKISLPFTEKSVNVFNSNNLNLTCVTSYKELANLPDGVYTIKYSISPNQERYTEKSFFRIDILECKYSNAFLRLDLSGDCSEGSKDEKKKLREVRILMDGVISNMNDCNPDLALKLYNKASKLLDNLVDGECDCY